MLVHCNCFQEPKYVSNKRVLSNNHNNVKAKDKIYQLQFVTKYFRQGLKTH